MNAVLKLLAVIAFGVIGGYLIYLAAGRVDGLLSPDCDLCRLAAVSLFATFLIVFGLLAFVWPTPGQSDSFHWH